VVGIDFSQHFIDVANEMKKNGTMEYEATIQGDITEKRQAAVPSDINRSKVVFEQGDACNLPPTLGKYIMVSIFRKNSN